MKTATLKTPGARLVVISTAGAGADTPLGRLRARALALPDVTTDGAFTDCRGNGLRLLEWAVPADADVDDPEVVKQANPASWITTDALAGQRQAIPDMAYRRYHCNQWGSGEGAWLPPGAWQKCVGEPELTDGEPIWIGVDVGGERSASAVVWVNERLHVGCGIYEGDQGVLDCVDHVRELAARYSVRELVFDPWRFGQAAQELEREGMTVVAFPQHDARMIPASVRLHSALVNQRLTLPNDPCSPVTRLTPSPGTPAAAGASTSPTRGRTSTRSSPCAWPLSAPRSSPNPWNYWDGCKAGRRARRIGGAA